MSQYKYLLRLCVNQIVSHVAAIDDYVNYYDLTCVISGSLTYIINGTTYVVNSGDVCFIKPDDHRVRMASSQTAHYVSINFFPNEDSEIILPPFLPKCVTSELKTWILALQETTKDYGRSTTKEKQDLLLRIILLSLQDALFRSRQNPYINLIFDYIAKHFTEKITLQDIADHVALSKQYCAYLVKKEVGKTVFEIILHERIQLAKTYVLQGEKSFTEISKLCGFNDYGYFSRYFKKATGMSPLQYRKLK